MSGPTSVEPSRGRAGPLLVATVLAATVLPTCIAHVDRPVAEALCARFHGSSVQALVARLLSPLPGLAALALVVVFAASHRRSSGRPLPPWSATPFVLSFALVWAVGITVVLKHVFGRSALDPMYLEHDIYTFRLFRASWGYDSFPSGTTCIAATLLTTHWLRCRRLLGLHLLLLLAVVAGVLVTSGHWLSDALAGAYVGFVIGRQTQALVGDLVPASGPAGPAASSELDPV